MTLQQDIPQAIRVAVYMPGTPTSDTPLTGWVLVGRVDESPQKNWQPQAATLAPINCADLRKGAELVVRGRVFIRGDDGNTNGSQRDVIGIAEKGERLRVLDQPHASKSKLGGNFIWVRVERLHT